jgi:hypothetical protein
MDRLGEPLTYVEVNEIVGKGVYGNVKVKREDWENTLSHILGAQYKTKDLRKRYRWEWELEGVKNEEGRGNFHRMEGGTK